MPESERSSNPPPVEDEARLRALSTSLHFVEAVRREAPRLSRRLRAGRGEECGAEIHALVEGLRALAELFAELDHDLGERGPHERGVLARLLRDVVRDSQRADWLALAGRLDGTLLPAAPRWQHALAARLESVVAARPGEPATGAAGEPD